MEVTRDIAQLPAQTGAAKGGGRRIATLDILRGFALLGMVLAHFHKTMGDGGGTSPLEGGLDRLIWLTVTEKDRAIFAFLFGVSFALMMRQLELRGLPVVTIFLRRLIVLYAIGFAVEVFTRFSILREYAFWGMPLLFLRRCSTRALLGLAVVSAAAFSIRDLGDSAHAVITRGVETTRTMEAAQLEAWEKALTAAAEAENQSGYAATVRARLARIVGEPILQRLTPDIILALFIVGFLAVRHGILDEPKRHVRLIAWAGVAGFLAWVVYWWVLPRVPTDWLLPRLAVRWRTGFGLIDEQLLAFSYMAGIVLLLTYRPAVETRWMFFAWVGRLALTNYIVHAVLLDLVSSRYGLAWQMRPTMELLGTAMLFGVQVVFSRLWLARFEFGPMERVWRSLTYLGREPARRPSTVSSVRDPTLS